MIGYRHCDARFPFLWEDEQQPPGRWHGHGEGPANYFADTTDGAWAEFLRHEEISDPVDLAGVRRAMWVVGLGEVTTAAETKRVDGMGREVMVGGPDSYPRCQDEARRLRRAGASALLARSAALKEGDAAGFHTDHGLRRAAPADGGVVVMFGIRPELVGWQVCAEGRPNVRLLASVRHFSDS